MAEMLDGSPAQWTWFGRLWQSVEVDRRHALQCGSAKSQTTDRRIELTEELRLRCWASVACKDCLPYQPGLPDCCCQCLFLQAASLTSQLSALHKTDQLSSQLRSVPFPSLVYSFVCTSQSSFFQFRKFYVKFWHCLLKSNFWDSQIPLQLLS